jgi:hypothetical protein
MYRKPSGKEVAAKRSGVPTAGNRRGFRMKAEFMSLDIGGKIRLSTISLDR